MSDGLLEAEKIVPVTIEEEMKGAYMDYAMSVIVSRALPDVRDGLKPVHRRVLYTMAQLGNTHSKPYKKSARVVGDVMGKYHPHGDIPIYDAVVRLAQDFSMREPLIDGQGNFGSIDGDSPAAMRYTEVRMAEVTEELLAELDAETVDFVPNYDGSLEEPVVLPAKFPHLLVNGSTGIAVGMATNIPPHHLGEVIDATVALIQNPHWETEQLLPFLQGPDFPTAGFILGRSGFREAYRTGRGSILLRGKAEIEVSKGDRERIVISELPYQVNKAKLIEKIAELVKEKKIEGISDLRDESDRNGMRVVVELKRGENGAVLLNQLYKHTALQTSYAIHLLAIDQKRPRTFQLKDMLWAFIEHRKEVVTRRTLFEFKKAEAKAHLLEGLKKAVESLDVVIQLIRQASSPDQAKQELIRILGLSLAQAQAVLEMRLQRLTALERDHLLRDYEAILKKKAELQAILDSEALVFQMIQGELLEIQKKYTTPRRTQILIDTQSEWEDEDLIAPEEALVVITHGGYVKRMSPQLFRSQRRGGRGVSGMQAIEGDFVRSLYRTHTLHYLLCFTNQGRLYWLKVHRIPEVSRISKGKAIVNLLQLLPGEKVQAILETPSFSENQFLFLVTRRGIVKKTPLSEFQHVRATGVRALMLEEGDEVVGVKITQGQQHIFLCTRNGFGICFSEQDVRSMGRSAHGVYGIRFKDGEEKAADEVVGMEVLNAVQGVPVGEILIVSEKGFGKRTLITDFRFQNRGGQGMVAMKPHDKTGPVMGCCQVVPEEDLVLVSNQGQIIRIRVADISEQGRYAQGVKLMNLEADERLVSMEPLAEDVKETENEGG